MTRRRKRKRTVSKTQWTHATGPGALRQFRDVVVLERGFLHRILGHSSRRKTISFVSDISSGSCWGRSFGDGEMK
jgi:hypothetical protein